MVEADSHLKLLPTFIINIYKLFEHIDMLFMGIQYHSYTVILLGTERPSPTKSVPGTRPLPVTQRLDFPNRSLTWADQTRIPIATK